MAAIPLGSDAKAYYNSTALTAIAVAADLTAATVIGNITDVDVNLEGDSIDTSTRETAATGWGTEQVTFKKASATFTMFWKSGDTAFAALRTAFLNNTEVFMAFLDKASSVTGAQGIAGNWNVKKFGKSEKLKDAQSVSVELVLSSNPSWYVKS